MKLAPAVVLAGALLTACTAGGPRPTSEATVITSSATVEAVDPATRAITLRDTTDGSLFTVTAAPEVRNFDQIEPGDRVELDFLESIVLELADPADDGEPMALVGGMRAPEGERPGGAAIVSTSAVVEVVSYDADTGFATFRMPDGAVRRATLPPSLRAFAAARRPGDRVLVSITDAVAVSVTPADA
jgi:hypothetical protein